MALTARATVPLSGLPGLVSVALGAVLSTTREPTTLEVPVLPAASMAVARRS